MLRHYDIKPLGQRKNKSKPYYCNTCGDVATAEALFEVDQGTVIIMQRLCARCLSSANYELPNIPEVSGGGGSSR
ncbi:hypothetical protein NVIE_024910 [Nitrososphaera viennensis EN76]|uniref:Uncharacterized protein n=1 Tax=Nitrososphaera viennensis EN76 TaxID=926571 RepID=A0A060HMN7_9ARCH|nr:hypothetical protein NVIE_024910 [Nitrososphaera viennensis EN76]